MLQILDTLKVRISPEMISRASSPLTGESDSKVDSAVSAIIPGLLAGLLKKGETPQMKNILEDAANSTIMTDVCDNYNLTGNNLKSVGDRFKSAVLGNKTAEFNSDIASHAGISTANAGKLTAIVAPVVAAFLGDKMKSNNLSVAGLFNELDKEKDAILSHTPASITNTLNLSTNNTKMANNDKTTHIPVKGKKNNSWLWWLLLAALIILCIIWWRSCDCKNDVRDIRDRTTEVVDTVSNRNDRVVENVRNRNYTDVELPDGTRLRAYRNGMEDKMIRFLDSDDYKNAKADDLKNKWYHFDDLYFEHGSATDFTDDSHQQLDNIAAIMKYYPDAKIEIAGYADKTGSPRVNMDISEARANNIKRYLVNKGVNASRIVTEGFGEKYATHSENESDEEREEDRTITIRFIK